MYGIQVFDSSMRATLNIGANTRLSRFIQEYTGSIASQSSLFVAVSGMVNDGTWGAHGIGFETNGSWNYYPMYTTIGTGGFTVENVLVKTQLYNVKVIRF